MNNSSREFPGGSSFSNTESLSFSHILLQQLERQGMSVNRLPTRQSDWDWFLRSVDKAYADASAQEVLFSRANNIADEELSALKGTLKEQSELLVVAQKDSHLTQKTLDIAGLGWFVFDAATSTVSVNAAMASMLGLEKAGADMPLAVLRHSLREEDQQVLLNAIAKATATNEQQQMEFRPKGANFDEKWLTCRLTSHRESQVTSRRVLGVVHDVSSQRIAEQRANNLATYDPLTRVCNQQHFFSYCRNKMAASETSREPFALLFIDLDGFKEFNDSLGHKTGDQILQIIAQRITGCMPDPTCVARYAGDEFLVMVKNAADVRHVQTLADSLLNQIGKPVKLDVAEVSISASIGMTFFPADGDTVDRLLQNADTAMHQAKVTGRNTWKAYTESMNSEMSARFEMITRLRSAIAEGKLELAFQPIVNGENRQIRSVEALARWYDAELGPIAPAIFIPLAESCGLIEAIGQFVLRRALKTLKDWDQAGAPPTTVSVNFSAIQFSNPNFVEMIRSLLAEYKFPPNRLQVEITEGVMINDITDCSAKLQALRRLGVLVALDDFGTGYSSLAYLESLPIDCIKIDKSFVSKIVAVDQTLPMIRAIIALADSLGMDILAEGIENEVQRQALLRMGCKMMQGYYFNRPMSDYQVGRLLMAGNETQESKQRKAYL
jgi:diguanylate cyclase (GGDEF)-like protein/PAS domain S-box-containing protein